MTKSGGTDYDRAIGERAAHIRKVLSMPLQEVADKLGVTRQTLSNYESGRTPMRADVMRMLCEVYRAPAGWLLGMDDRLDHKSSHAGRTLEIHEVSASIASPSRRAE